MIRILGIDPGTIKMGFGLVESESEAFRVVDCGVLSASTGLERGPRLYRLHTGLLDLLGRLHPSEVAIEEPFLAKNVQAALAIGEARGIALLAAASLGIPAYSYTPRQIKLAVSGYGASTKEQVQEMVRLQLGLAEAPFPLDASDALAVALCHLHSRWLGQLMG